MMQYASRRIVTYSNIYSPTPRPVLIKRCRNSCFRTFLYMNNLWSRYVLIHSVSRFCRPCFSSEQTRLSAPFCEIFFKYVYGVLEPETVFYGEPEPMRDAVGFGSSKDQLNELTQNVNQVNPAKIAKKQCESIFMIKHIKTWYQSEKIFCNISRKKPAVK